MPFPYEDIRTFIDECENEDKVVRVKKEVDWNLEAGAIARRLAETGRGRALADGGTPAVVFEKVKGYPDGFRLAGQILASKDRIAKALGYVGSNMKEAMDKLQDIVLNGMRNPIKPVLVDKKNAPCKQNIMVGDDINLYKFPAPMIHDGDGGRYMHTWGFVITKDRDSEWVNWGTYRSMIADRKTLTGIIEPQQDIGKIRQKYLARKEPMPFAIVVGPDPASFTIGSTAVLPGQSEGDIAGGIRGKPVLLVQCETNDLAVPATAEIVIEGFVHPTKKIWEGPYGEYTGYRASPRDLRPIYQVTAITYRDNPILTFDPTGTPNADFASSFGDSAMAAEALNRVGIQARVWLMPESAHTLCVVAVKNVMPNIATMVKNTLTSQQGLQSLWTFKFLVVNDDVDIYDPAEVLWAISTRVHPRRGLIVSDEICGPLTPYASLDERLKKNAPHLTFDGTWPLDWHPTIAVPPVSSFKSIYPEEIQEKVNKNWEAYGLR
ncbi:MAG: UbiD family decarboxylase [Desulfatiglandales bacterium]|nr:UbiD family decarboxylase [Desulfatiglandales bacterium]